MSALRYVMSEQQSVDWMFKTSFVKSKHNRESLSQSDITFNNDNLVSYQNFVEEFKPYSTKIREFISEYTVIDPTNSSVSDFDLQPSYNKLTDVIEASTAVIKDNEISNQNLDTDNYPRKNWANNHGYEVTEIKLGDGGTGYTFEPVIKLTGGGGTGAKAKAYLGYGKITSIKVTYPGSGYTTAPTVVISGSQTDAGTPAQAPHPSAQAQGCRNMNPRHARGARPSPQPLGVSAGREQREARARSRGARGSRAPSAPSRCAVPSVG